MLQFDDACAELGQIVANTTVICDLPDASSPIRARAVPEWHTVRSGAQRDADDGPARNPLIPERFVRLVPGTGLLGAHIALL